MPYCIDQSLYDPTKHRMVGGPYEDENCMGCPQASSSSMDPSYSSSSSSSQTVGGSLFRISDASSEDFIAEIRNPQTIESARLQISGEEPLKGVTGIIIPTRVDYNPNYSFHYDPNTVEFFEVAIEVCDSTFQYTEEHLAEAGGAFLPGFRLCPWSSRVVEEITSSSSSSEPTTTTQAPTTTTQAPTTTTQAPTTTSPPPIIVTVASGTNSFGTGNKYYLNGSLSPTINMIAGVTYVFDVSNASNSNLPFRFSHTPDGTNAGGSEYTSGVSRTGRAGQTGAKVTIVAPAPTTLNYYSSNLAGMGNSINIS